MASSTRDRHGRTSDADAAGSPIKLAHVVFRTSRFTDMIAWYSATLAARTVFKNELLCFLTYDEEHHRIALLNVPQLTDQLEGEAGVHHVAFTYATLGDLFGHYEDLKQLGIRPRYVINHGPTTSLYYQDPDGNQIEFQVENFDTPEAAGSFFQSAEFAENPIGVEFDADEMLGRLRAGEPESALKKRPLSGGRGLADIKLR